MQLTTSEPWFRLLSVLVAVRLVVQVTTAQTADYPICVLWHMIVTSMGGLISDWTVCSLLALMSLQLLNTLPWHGLLSNSADCCTGM